MAQDLPLMDARRKMKLRTAVRTWWGDASLQVRLMMIVAAVLLAATMVGGLVLGPIGIRALQSDWSRPMFLWAPVPRIPKIAMLMAYGAILAAGLLAIALCIGIARAEPATLARVQAGGSRLLALFRWQPKTAAVLLVLCSLPLLWATVVRPFRVPNEFLSLPSQTIGADGVVRQNLDFIRDHRFEGMAVPLPDGKPPQPLRIGIRSANALASSRALANETPENFWLDVPARQLEVHWIQTLSQYQALLAICAPADLPRLQKKFTDDMRDMLAFSTRQYSPEERDFLRRNRDELERALVLGRFFYHHNFIFQAAVAQAVDPSTAVGSQYGKGLTQVFAAVLRATPEPLRFNAYLLMLYASYPLYLLLALVVGRACGLARWPLVFVAAATLFSYVMSDVETVRLGVGLAPWRHILDLAVLYTVYRFARVPGWANFALLAGLTCAGIYWSREMGAFLGLSVTGALIAYAAMRRSAMEGARAALLLVAVGIAFQLSDPHAQMLTSAVLLGVNTPGLPFGSAFVWATAAVACGMFALWLWLVPRPQDGGSVVRLMPEWTMLGASILYAIASGIYLMYYPRPHHLAPYFPAMALGGAVGLKLLRQALPGRIALGRLQRACTLTVVVLLAGTALLAVVRTAEVAREERIFRTHVNHDWNFPAGQLTSTGDPALLQQAVAMIRARERNASIDILSPWEVALLPLSGKGKRGPFVLSFDSLVTEAEVIRLRDHLLREGSGILFVDTRLVEGAYEQPLHFDGYMDDRVYASGLRIRAHAMLREVFARVAPCFRLDEKGPLISTYVRVSNSCTP